LTTVRNRQEAVPRAGEDDDSAGARLAALWREVLEVERVEPDDNFFALGGDSLDAIRLAARASRAGLHCTPRMLMQFPTLRLLAGAAATDAPSPAAPGEKAE